MTEFSVEVIKYCKSHNVEDAVEILRCLQNIMVEGRALSIQDPTSFDDGETNFIMVDRYNILKTSFDEVKCLKNLRKTLEVQFYGEVS